MSDQGDLELFTGPAPSEKSEMGDEQFREDMQRTQQALQQLRKEEGQAKAYDYNLAAIIVHFLSQPQNTDLFLLVSRNVAQNIPSELLIAVLSLIDKKAQEEVKGYLETGPAVGKSTASAIVIHQKADFKSLPPHDKKAIDKWIENIAKVAAKKPHRALESVIIPGPQRAVSPVLIQLSAFILRNFLTSHEIKIEFQSLRDFMQGVFVEIIKNLEVLLKEQKQIR